MTKKVLKCVVLAIVSLATNFTVEAQILIKDIYPGSWGSGIDVGEIIGNKLFFTAQASDSNSELWVSDREIDSTYIIGPVLPGVDLPVGNTALYHVFRDSLLVFTTSDFYDVNIYSTNGTLGGTQFIKKIVKGRSTIYEFIGFNNKFYFPGYDAVHRTELWESDGTVAGTHHLLNTLSGLPAPSPVNFKTYNNRLWFSSYGQPWYVDDASLILADSYYPKGNRSLIFFVSSDTEPAFFVQPYNISGDNFLNKRLVKVNPDASMETIDTTLSKNSEILAYNNHNLIYYEIDYGVSPSTTNISSLNANSGVLSLLTSSTSQVGKGGSIPDNDNIFFSMLGDNGWELWGSDGSPSGTNKIDFSAGAKILSINFITDEKNERNLGASGNIFFNANLDGSDSYMWMSDGTVSGTKRLEFEGQPLIFSNFLRYTNGIIFPAYHPLYGTELFYTDGTSVGTKLLAEIVPGMTGNSPYMLGIISDTLFVAANISTDYGAELYALPINLCGSCPDGYACVNGECVEMDPCADVSCPEGDICYEGGCFASCVGEDDERCFDLGPNLAAGYNATIQLDAGSGYDVYKWSTGELEQKIKVNTSGRYWVTAYNLTDEFFGTDTVSVIFKCDPQGVCPEGFECIDGYCINTDACSDVSCPDGSACFQGGCFPSCDENSTADVCYSGQEFMDAPCEYVLCAEGDACFEGGCYPTDDPCADVSCPEGDICYEGGCFASCVGEDDERCFDLGPNLSAGYNTTVQLDAGNGFDAYQWSTGEVEQKINVNTSGRYWVTGYNRAGEFFGTDTVSVLFKCDPQGACPEGFECVDGYCISTDVCADVSCPAGNICWEGGCFPNCDENSTSELCFFGQELETAPCEDVICAAGEVCYEGGCFPDLCTDVECPVGTSCYEGDCLPTCAPDVPCPEGEICHEGVCIDPCAGVICPVGQICYEGSCFVYDPCAGVDCLEGQACYLGSCFLIQNESGNLTMQGNIAEENDGNSGGKLASTRLPLENVKIVLFDETKTAYYASAVSDSEGTFEFSNLPAGTYKVAIDSYPYEIRGNDLIHLTNVNAKYNLQITLVDGAWEVELNVITGFSDYSQISSGLSIYPNPTRSSLYYNSTSDLGKAELRIYNPLGELVKQKHIRINEGDRNLIYEFSSGQKGFYLVQVSKDGQILLSSKVLILGY